jgi:serine/threonine protein kinase
VLISDFGESENLLSNRDIQHARSGATGTLEFTAPEMLKGSHANFKFTLVNAHGEYYVEFAPSADLWSLGMVLHFLCCGRLPFMRVDDIDLLKQDIKSINTLNVVLKRDDLPRETQLVLTRLLSKNPRDRPTASSLVNSLSHLRNIRRTSILHRRRTISQNVDSVNDLASDSDHERDASPNKMTLPKKDPVAPVGMKRVNAGVLIALVYRVVFACWPSMPDARLVAGCLSLILASFVFSPGYVL